MSNIPNSSMPFNDNATDGSSVTAAIWNQAMQTLVTAVNDNYTRIINITNAQATVLVAQGTSYPTAPSTGQLIYRTDLAQLKMYNGTTWVDVESTVNAASNLIVSGANLAGSTSAAGNTVAVRDSTGGLTVGALTASSGTFSSSVAGTGFTVSGSIGMQWNNTNNQLYWVGGTSGYYWANNANNATVATLSNTGLFNAVGGLQSNGNNVFHSASVIPVANGGTGSSTQNFVDLTTAQTIGGAKTFTSHPTVANTESSDSAFGILNYNAALGANITNKNIGGVQWLINGVSKLGNIMYANTDGAGAINYNRSLWYSYPLGATIFSMDLITGALFSKNNTIDDGSGAATLNGLTQVNAPGVGSSVGNVSEILKTKSQSGSNANFLIHRLFRDTAGSDWTGVTVELLKRVDATDHHKIRLEPDGSINLVPYSSGGIKWNGVAQPQLRYSNGYVEWNNNGTWQGVGGVKNVQRGTASIPNGTNGTLNITITSVNTAKAFVTFNNLAYIGGGGATEVYTASLTSATNLQIFYYNGTTLPTSLVWEVVESY